MLFLRISHVFLWFQCFSIVSYALLCFYDALFMFFNAFLRFSYDLPMLFLRFSYAFICFSMVALCFHMFVLCSVRVFLMLFLWLSIAFPILVSCVSYVFNAFQCFYNICSHMCRNHIKYNDICTQEWKIYNENDRNERKTLQIQHKTINQVRLLWEWPSSYSTPLLKTSLLTQGSYSRLLLKAFTDSLSINYDSYPPPCPKARGACS